VRPLLHEDAGKRGNNLLSALENVAKRSKLISSIDTVDFLFLDSTYSEVP
jgi:hypothetical protein